MSDLIPREKGDEIRVDVGRERKPLKRRSCLADPLPGAADWPCAVVKSAVDPTGDDWAEPSIDETLEDANETGFGCRRECCC